MHFTKLFDKVQKKYGHKARVNLAENLYRALPADLRRYVDEYGKTIKPEHPTLWYESKLNAVVDYLENYEKQRQFHVSKGHIPESELGVMDSRPVSPIHVEYLEAMGKTLKILKDLASKVDRRWVESQLLHKSEESISLNEEDLKNLMYAIGEYAEKYSPEFEAAKILSEGYEPTEDQILMAIKDHEGDLEAIALASHGISVTKENKAKLKELRFLKKAQQESYSLVEESMEAPPEESKKLAKIVPSLASEVGLGAPHPHDDAVWINPILQIEEAGLTKDEQPVSDPAPTQPTGPSPKELKIQQEKTQLASMYKPDHAGFATKEAHVDWAHGLKPDNWRQLVVKHHREKPEDFTPEVKGQWEHFNGMLHLSEIQNAKFGKEHDIHSALNQLKQLEQKGIERTKNKMKIVSMPETAKKIVDVGGDMAWYDLGKQSCNEEGKAMGHCGNTASQNKHDRVLSLRKRHVLGGNEYFEPHLTFIKNGNVLGEMKGRANTKPKPEHHDAIIALLNAERLLPVGGGYAPEKNFSLLDLSEEHFDKLHPDIKEAFSNLEGLSKFKHGDGKEADIATVIEQPQISDIMAEQIAKHLKYGNTTQQKNLWNKFLANPKILTHPTLSSNFSLDPNFNPGLAANPIIFDRPQLLEKFLSKDFFDPRLVDQGSEIRENFAKNKNLFKNPELLEKLAKDLNEDVVRRIVDRQPLDKFPNLIETLASHPSGSIKDVLAQKNYISASPAAFKKLSKDPETKESIADHPDLGKFPDIYSNLANDDSSIRVRIANRADLSDHPEVFKKLSEDSPSDDYHCDVPSKVAAHPNLSKFPDIYLNLANSPSDFVRSTIARRSDLDKFPEIFKKLSQDTSKNVGKILAENSILGQSPEIVDSLLRHPNPEVPMALAFNENLLKDPETYNKISNVFEKNLNQEQHNLFFAAKHPALVRFPELIKKIISDQNPTARQVYFAQRYDLDAIPRKLMEDFARNVKPIVAAILLGNFPSLKSRMPSVFNILASRPEEEIQGHIKQMTKSDPLNKTTKLSGFPNLGVKVTSQTPIVAPGSLPHTVKEKLAEKVMGRPVEPKVSGMAITSSKGHKIAWASSVGGREHEDFHLAIKTMKKKHGPEITENVIHGMFNSVHPEGQRAMIKHILTRIPKDEAMKLGPTKLKEEAIAHALTYLNSPAHRQSFHQKNPQTPPHEFASHMKKAFRAIQKYASTVTLPKPGGKQ